MKGVDWPAFYVRAVVLVGVVLFWWAIVLAIDTHLLS